jgi:hypothetical protein
MRLYGSVRGAISDGRPYRDSNCAIQVSWDYFRIARHSGRMLSLTCEKSRIRQNYSLGRRQQVSAIYFLRGRRDPRVNQRLASSGSLRGSWRVLFVS